MFFLSGLHSFFVCLFVCFYQMFLWQNWIYKQILTEYLLILTTMKLLSSTRKGLTLVMIKYIIASKNILLMRLLDMQAIINTQINNLFDLLIKWDFLIWVTEKIDAGRSAVVENQMCIPTSWGLKKFHLLLIQPFEWRASYLRDQNSFTT